MFEFNKLSRREHSDDVHKVQIEFQSIFLSDIMFSRRHRFHLYGTFIWYQTSLFSIKFMVEPFKDILFCCLSSKCSIILNIFFTRTESRFPIVSLRWFQRTTGSKSVYVKPTWDNRQILRFADFSHLSWHFSSFVATMEKTRKWYWKMINDTFICCE